MPVHLLPRFPVAGRLALVLALAVALGQDGEPPLAATAPTDHIPLDEIRPGMTGYGLTVFSGSKVDTFAVTVIGIQENVRAAGSFLVVELAGHGLEVSSIAQGMSGSPIYIEGRFAGALSFGWPGALRPLAGVTPAAEMLALPVQPQAVAPPKPRAVPPGWDILLPDAGAGADLATALFGAAPPPPSSRGAYWSRIQEWPAPDELFVSLLRRSLATAGVAAALPEHWIYQPLGLPVSAAAAAAAERTNRSLTPGAACAVPLVTGDAALGAIGTVTWSDGDRVLLMGHPFMQRGPVNLPLATADILTVLPSREMSFKIGAVGTILGTVHHDQRAGLAGRLGAGPDMIPVTVEVVGVGGRREYRFDVVDDPMLSPVLVFWALYNAVLVEGDDASRQTVRYSLASHWEGPVALGRQPLEWSGVVAGPGAVASLGSEIMAPLALLMDNASAPVRLREISARLDLSRPDATAAVVGLSGPRSLPAGGGEALFEITLQPRLGEAATMTIPVRLPSHLRPGPYRVVAASAAELFALEAQRVAGVGPPRDLPDLLELLNRDRSPGTLVLAIFAPGQGVVVAGQEMAALPGSVGRLMRAGNRLAGRTLADYVLREARPSPWVLQGHAIRTLELQAGEDPVGEEKRP